MKHKYDLDNNTPTEVVKQRLADARKERRIYVVANIVRVLKSRGLYNINLTEEEQNELYEIQNHHRFKH